MAAEEKLYTVGSYDTKIKIENPDLFISRVVRAARAVSNAIVVDSRRVVYDFSDEICRSALDFITWGFHVFQKPNRFSEESEYRISLFDADMHPEVKEYIDLTLGFCGDVVSIVSSSKS